MEVGGFGRLNFAYSRVSLRDALHLRGIKIL